MSRCYPAVLRFAPETRLGIQHPEFLKGGAGELSNVLSKCIKAEPERFYLLLQRAPNDLDDSYVSAFLNSFAESDKVPDEWLFYTIRRFAFQSGRNIKRPVAWVLEKRVFSELPEDLSDMLLDTIHQVPGDDEWRWGKGANHRNAYDSYLNSDRGSSFDALMRIYDRMETNGVELKWSLFEFVAKDPSTALRAGAIHELIYMINHGRERSIQLFQQLIDGHDVLYENNYTREFIYWAFYKNFLKLEPYIYTMMHYDSENVKKQGAQLACIAEISIGAMENENAKIRAQSLAETVMEGDLPWRRGAATVYCRNIIGPTDLCMPKLLSLLDEDDDQIQQDIGFIFRDLSIDDFMKLRGLAEKYAGSSKKVGVMFIEGLSKYGLIDPEWTLSIIQIVLENPAWRNVNPWEVGAEELIRLVLRLYADPTLDDQQRSNLMDIFDILMERYTGFAQKVLSEWDRK